MTARRPAIIAALCASAVVLVGSSARAQLGPPPTLPVSAGDATTPTVEIGAPPALPQQSIEPPDAAQMLPAMVVPRELQFSTSIAPRAVNPRFQVQDHFVRAGIATMASLGTTLIAGSLTTGATILAGNCPWSCGVSSAATVGTALSALSMFVVPATYTLAADRFGSRGSFWATFAGFATGALVGGGIVALDVLYSNGRAPSAVSVAIAAFLPFAAQAFAYELTAKPVEVSPPRVSTRPRIIPTIALGADALPLVGAVALL